MLPAGTTPKVARITDPARWSADRNRSSATVDSAAPRTVASWSSAAERWALVIHGASSIARCSSARTSSSGASTPRSIVSPGAPIRRGDRVVVKTRDGEVMVKELKRRTAKQIELQSLNPEHSDRTLAVGDVDWIARIVWASQ